MKMNTKTTLGLTAAACAFAAFPALAEDSEEIAELRARVEALEASEGAAPSGDLNIGNTAIDIYGYVKADFFYDFEFDQGDTAFVNVIGEPSAATDGHFGATVRQSRIGLRSTTPSDIGDITGQLELDLFGGSSSSPELRVRHANVRIGDTWLIGQYWTNFMPLAEYPTTVEFNGPVGIAFARVPQVRYTADIAANTVFSASVEENVSGSASDDPVLTAAVAYSTDRFSLRAAGLYGTATSGGAEVDQTGITLAGSVRPWEGGLFQVTYVNGEALGPWLIGVGNAIVGGQANDVDGYTIELRQDLGNRWNVGVAYGREDYDLPTSTGTLSFTELETIHVNAFYQATDNLTLMAEYIYGERNDVISGNTFDGSRVQLAAQWTF